MSRQRWRHVRHDHRYKVSAVGGLVRSLPRVLADGRMHGGGLLTPVPDKDGYLRVRIGGRWVAVHILVLEAFDRPKPDGMEGCHWPNPDRSCNDLENLRWDTHRENERDKARQPERLDWIGTSRPGAVETAVTAGAADG